MSCRRRAAGAALALALPLAAWGAVHPAYRVPARWLAQDSSGAVWAAAGGYAARQAGWQPGLYRWGRGGFHLAHAAGPDFQPTGIWALGAGIVVANWVPMGGYESLSWYRHGRKAALARLGPGCLSVQQVVISRGVIYALCLHSSPAPPWVLSLRIFRVAAGRPAALAWRLGPLDMFPFPQQPGRSPIVLPLHATRTPDGAVWLWAGMPARAGTQQILRGFLVLRGPRVVRLASVPGLPGAPLTAVGPWDSRYLAAAVLGGGIYLIDTQRLRARPLALPAAGNFRWVQKIFRAHGAHYLITTTPGRILRLTPGHRLRDVLWRERGGQWARVIAGLDDASRPALAAKRPFLAAPDGLWLGTMASGLWWIPSRLTPRLLDWRAGFPLEQVSRLFRLPNGNIVAFSHWGRRAVAFAPRRLRRPLPPPRALSRLRVVNPRLTLALDGDGNVWGVVTTRSHALSEWTGRGWRGIALPPEIEPRAVSGVDADRRGRIWLFPDCFLGMPEAIYDPAENQWAVYANYRAALTTLARPVSMLNARQDRMAPVYGPNGQIAYRGDCLGINYFDGQRWRLWNRADWPGPPSAFLHPKPFFNRHGHLALDLRHSTWVWQSPGWHLAAYQPQPDQTALPPAPRSALDGCGSPPAVSLVRDQWGRQWWTTAAGDLYMGLPGSLGPGPPCRRVLAASRRQPFLGGQRLARAFTDRWGNLFLLVQAAGIGKYVILSPPAPPPAVRARVSAAHGAAVSITISSSEPNGAQFIWRLDGGAWSRPSRVTGLGFRHLIPGRHRLTVQTFNRQMEAAGRPAQLAFTIAGTPQQSIQQLLAQLAAAKTNAARQAIVRQLLRYPRSALLPALRRAEPAASPAELWWLRAAEQEERAGR